MKDATTNLKRLPWLLAFLLALPAPGWADQKAGMKVPAGTATGQVPYWNGSAYVVNGYVLTNGTQIGIGVTPTTTDRVSVNPSGTTESGLTIQMPSGATGNEFQGKTSTGVVNFALNANGNVTISGTTNTAGLATLSGGFFTKGAGYQTRTISANYSVTATDNIIFVNGTFTVTLPSAAGSFKQFTIKEIGAGTATVVVSGGAQTIDGATSLVISTQNQSRTVQADQSNYQIVGGYL